MEIEDILRKLADIKEHGNKGDAGKFLKTLSLRELADLGGYAIALKESSQKIATNKILKGDHL